MCPLHQRRTDMFPDLIQSRRLTVHPPEGLIINLPANHNPIIHLLDILILAEHIKIHPLLDQIPQNHTRHVHIPDLPIRADLIEVLLRTDLLRPDPRDHTLPGRIPDLPIRNPSHHTRDHHPDHHPDHHLDLRPLRDPHPVRGLLHPVLLPEFPEKINKIDSMWGAGKCLLLTCLYPHPF